MALYDDIRKKFDDSTQEQRNFIPVDRYTLRAMTSGQRAELTRDKRRRLTSRKRLVKCPTCGHLLYKEATPCLSCFREEVVKLKAGVLTLTGTHCIVHVKCDRSTAVVKLTAAVLASGLGIHEIIQGYYCFNCRLQAKQCHFEIR